MVAALLGPTLVVLAAVPLVRGLRRRHERLVTAIERTDDALFSRISHRVFLAAAHRDGLWKGGSGWVPTEGHQSSTCQPSGPFETCYAARISTTSSLCSVSGSLGSGAASRHPPSKLT